MGRYHDYALPKQNLYVVADPTTVDDAADGFLFIVFNVPCLLEWRQWANAGSMVVDRLRHWPFSVSCLSVHNAKLFSPSLFTHLAARTSDLNCRLINLRFQVLIIA